MERRQDSLVPSVLSAGTDPAHVPGLDEPVTAPPDGETAQPADETPAAETAEAEAPAEVVPDEPAADAAAEEPEAEAESREGPSFEVSDRRGAILADGSGILFRLDDTEARIGWDEIGAVELGTGKFGRRFSVTVYTTTHRCFDGDVEAPSRRDVRAWTEEFDAVLDAWFDDGAKDEPAETAEESEETVE
jgi:hypothetical protein